MPRELIARDSTWVEGTGELVSRTAVELTWHRDAENVQIVLTNENGEDGEEQVLYSQPLTRPAINNLIKALRRARDQVYGRDE